MVVSRTCYVVCGAYITWLTLGSALPSPEHHDRVKGPGKVNQLLETPVRNLDDDEIWKVAGYLSASNFSNVSQNSEAKHIDDDFYTKMLEYIFGDNKEPVSSPTASKQDTKQSPIVTKVQFRPAWNFQPDRNSNKPPPAAKTHPQTTARPPQHSATDHRKSAATPRSKRDKFYFLRHIQSDLPALDRIETEKTVSPEPELTSTTVDPATVDGTAGPPLDGSQRLTSVLRAMVAYGEAVEGDEGTPDAVRKLVQRSRNRAVSPRARKAISRLVKDKSITKTRKKRGWHLKPDMTPLTDFMAQQTYSQGLINSFQTGSSGFQRHNSIKKELREPIDIDVPSQNVAQMVASLRKRSAPDPAAGAEEQSQQLTELSDLEEVGRDIDARLTRSPSSSAGTADTAQFHVQPAPQDSRLVGDPTVSGDATYSRAARSSAGSHGALKRSRRLRRRKRAAPGTRRVVDHILISPDLPDLMTLDPEDVLESDEDPLLPVIVNSGQVNEDPFVVTERGAVVLEDVGRRPTWSPWGFWGMCSATCGAGQKARYRHCVQGPRCEPGERESDFKPCLRKSCSIPVPSGLVDSF